MATNTITENIVFGYASGSDSPAYSKNVTTNVGEYVFGVGELHGNDRLVADQ